MTAAAMGIGRRITNVAMRCQRPSPTSRAGRCHNTSRSTREPSVAKSAGRNRMAPTKASATTAIPAYANDRRKNSGKMSSAPKEMATVRALNSTVRPAVRMVRTTASSGAIP